MIYASGDVFENMKSRNPKKLPGVRVVVITINYILKI